MVAINCQLENFFNYAAVFSTIVLTVMLIRNSHMAHNFQSENLYKSESFLFKIHCIAITCEKWRLKLPATWLFVKTLIQANTK